MARRRGTPAKGGDGLPGKLAVIGGRLEDNNAAIYAEMHRLSGGRILVFPTASAEPEEVGEETVQAFRGHGFAAEMAPLHAGPGAPRRRRPRRSPR